MTPDKALELVGRYARLTKQIRASKSRIGDNLELCNGLLGFRHEIGEDGFPTQRSADDQDTHLKDWYAADMSDDGPLWRGIGEEERAECPHCYAAHVVIRERKALRHQLAGVKAAITRGGA